VGVRRDCANSENVKAAINRAGGVVAVAAEGGGGSGGGSDLGGAGGGDGAAAGGDDDALAVVEVDGVGWGDVGVFTIKD